MTKLSEISTTITSVNPNSYLYVAQESAGAYTSSKITKTNFFASPAAIGSTTRATGAFTELDVTTDVIIGNNLDVGRDLSVADDLTVADDATIGDNLTVNGNTSLAGELSVDGNSLFTGYTRKSVANALTAAGTTRTDALQLAAEFNNVTTAASGTGVILPSGLTGMRIVIFNNGANPIKVYALASQTIDGTAGSTGVTLTNAKRCEYIYMASNTWISAQMGVVSA